MGVIPGDIGGHYFTHIHVHRRLLPYLEAVLALTTDPLHEKQMHKSPCLARIPFYETLRTKLYLAPIM
jgi:hypothetical protein